MNFKKALGLFLYNALGKHLPRSCSKLKIGRSFRLICGKLIIDEHAKCFNIEKQATFSSHIKIGSNSMIGYKCDVGPNTTIGDNVLMGPEVKILTQNHIFSRTDIPIREQGVDSKEVVIGNDVWIGTRVIILPGVIIGEGCVIGAGSIVTKNIPPYSVAVGNPAVVKKSRQEGLLSSKHENKE